MKVEYGHMVQNIPTTPRAQETRMANIVSSNPSLFLCPTHWGCHKTTTQLSTRKLRFAWEKKIYKNLEQIRLQHHLTCFQSIPLFQQLAQGCEPMSQALFLSQTKWCSSWWLHPAAPPGTVWLTLCAVGVTVWLAASLWMHLCGSFVISIKAWKLLLWQVNHTK